MEYKIKGKLILKAEPRQVSEKFRVMDFVIETQDEKYPQKIQFQILNDRIQEMDIYSLGEEIEVSFDVINNYIQTHQVVQITNHRKRTLYSFLCIYLQKYLHQRI